MASKSTYRVSVYTDRGTYLEFDAEFTARGRAVAAFHAQAARHVRNTDACVLLSRGNGTLASKSTDHRHVELHAAFYGETA
jgi:hypothetical protein